MIRRINVILKAKVEKRLRRLNKRIKSYKIFGYGFLVYMALQNSQLPTSLFH